MLTFAFDAGGDDSTAYMTVAGFASSTEHWDEFSKKWKARLDRDGIEFFHTIDANNFRGPFKHWYSLPNNEREGLRRSLFEDLMKIIQGNTFQKFSCTIVNKDYETTNNALRQEFVESAYSYGARACEASARQWVRADWRYCKEMQIAAIFELGDGGQDEGKMRERLRKDYGHFPPNFRPKKDTPRTDGTSEKGFIPLQAADWLAWEVNRLVRDIQAGKIHSEAGMRWPMQQFISRPSPYMTYVSSEELKHTNDMLAMMSKLMPLKDLMKL